MNTRLIMVMFFTISVMQGMDRPDKGPAILYETDSNGDVWYYDHHTDQKVKEQYEDFYCSLEATKDEEDTKKQYAIAQPLFIQLVVQASKAQRLDRIPFGQLLDKIRKKTIEIEQPQVVLTHKDAKYRLLSYIPQGNMDNNLVNGKKVRMITVIGMRDKIQPADAIQNNTPQSTVYDDLDPSCIIFPEYSKGYSSRGKEKEPSGQDTLTCHHDFLKDFEHHAKIVAEFNELIRNN